MAGLSRRVADVAGRTLATRKVVTPIDVVVGLRWVKSAQVDTWKQGRVGALEDTTAVDAAKLVDAVTALREWAQRSGLSPADATYTAASRDRRTLRFTRDGSDAVEQAFRVQWLAPGLTEARRATLTERARAAPDLVAHVADEPRTCTGCGGPAGFFVTEGDDTLCLACADLDHLAYLPAGNAALSRRAKKESGLSAVVVTFNRRRKRYERQGILVEEAALGRAEEQCFADSEVRERRRERDEVRRAAADETYTAVMADEIRRLFPGCPPERATLIARHAGERSSGRVGRSAAAKVFDPQAVTLAVVASVRHLDTDYDSLLMAGVPRREARDRIRSRIERVLTSWRA
ncbi:DUF2293 domain-containing protein [Cryptosporangium sp. NPDC051539]|uniref:DUF2293 domain-containing protein n=1 Tax=Cryptosporangium sp. NPDC051539 TaxID=3363962 RepID=UPI00379C175F